MKINLKNTMMQIFFLLFAASLGEAQDTCPDISGNLYTLPKGVLDGTDTTNPATACYANLDNCGKYCLGLVGYSQQKVRCSETTSTNNDDYGHADDDVERTCCQGVISSASNYAPAGCGCAQSIGSGTRKGFSPDTSCSIPGGMNYIPCFEATFNYVNWDNSLPGSAGFSSTVTTHSCHFIYKTKNLFGDDDDTPDVSTVSPATTLVNNKDQPGHTSAKSLGTGWIIGSIVIIFGTIAILGVAICIRHFRITPDIETGSDTDSIMEQIELGEIN
jgi:hypothetical protein